nr:tryptophan--trna ligase, chloroplastic/mitochondrial [Quercus suber]
MNSSGANQKKCSAKLNLATTTNRFVAKTTLGLSVALATRRRQSQHRTRDDPSVTLSVTSAAHRRGIGDAPVTIPASHSASLQWRTGVTLATHSATLWLPFADSTGDPSPSIHQSRKRLVSGVHLGNYLGAIKNWISLRVVLTFFKFLL